MVMKQDKLPPLYCKLVFTIHYCSFFELLLLFNTNTSQVYIGIKYSVWNNKCAFAMSLNAISVHNAYNLLNDSLIWKTLIQKAVVPFIAFSNMYCRMIIPDVWPWGNLTGNVISGNNLLTQDNNKFSYVKTHENGIHFSSTLESFEEYYIFVICFRRFLATINTQKLQIYAHLMSNSLSLNYVTYKKGKNRKIASFTNFRPPLWAAKFIQKPPSPYWPQMSN